MVAFGTDMIVLVGARKPKSNGDYWINKVARNRERDQQTERLLSDAGWQICVVWECELKDAEALRRKLSSFLA